MTYRIALNGLDTLGRIVLRHLVLDSAYAMARDVEVVAVNDVAPTAALAHLLKYDSSYGRFSAPVVHDGDLLTVGDWVVPVYHLTDPTSFPWGALDVDLVLEFGDRRRRDGRFSYVAHLEAGAKRVVIPGMAVNPDGRWLAGITDDPNPQQRVIAMGGRVRHSLAVVCKVLNDAFGLEHADAVAMLPLAPDQSMLDRPHGWPPYSRAGAVNIVASPEAMDWGLGLAVPELMGKVVGSNYRVPVHACGAMHLTGTTHGELSTDLIAKRMNEAAEGWFRGLLACTADLLTSRDALERPESCIFDLNHIHVQSSRRFKVAWWFDPTWTNALRCVELIHRLAAQAAQ